LPAGYNFFQIYGLYLTTLPEFNTFHLWFLAYLFVFSIVTLPVLVRMGKEGKSVVSRLAEAFDRPWALVLLLVVPLAVADAFLYPGGFWGSRSASGGWSVIAYVEFFIFGYLVFANQRIMEWIGRIGWFALAGAVVTAAFLLTVFFDHLVEAEAHYGTSMYVAAMTVEALNTWCFLLAILALGKGVLNANTRFLAYANEAVLPFYILHQTVIISVGYYVVQWSAGVGIKYLVISTTSFVVIMALYEIIRRLSFLRFVFGMRVNKARPREVAQGARQPG